MAMNRLMRFRRPIVWGLLLCLLSLLLDIRMYALTQDEGEVRVTNVNWTIEEDTIVITYDLNGPIDKKFDISVLMLRENDPAFNVAPIAMEGDVGEGFFVGTGRRIRWYYRSDIPLGIYGEGYYFQIIVKPVSAGIPWYTVAVGAAVVGGIVALLVMKKGDDAPATRGELPGPPTRPPTQ